MTTARLDAEKPPEGGRQKSQSWGIIPDLVLIDGGKGHLNAVVEVLLELGVDDVPLASPCKGERGDFRPGHP